MSTDIRLAWTFAFLASAAAATAQEPETTTFNPSIIVELADGSTLPMREWTLSYDYIRWPAQGGSPATADTDRKESSSILLGKKSIPVTGATVDILYKEEPRRADVDDDTTMVMVGVPRQVTVTPAGGGKPIKLKVEAPDRSLLLPDVGKETSVLARSLDLRGFTLTGTRRDFCLVTFTTLVQCGTSLSDRVVKIRFNP